MNKLITGVALLASVTFFGQTTLLENQEIKTNDTYFSVSGSYFKYGSTHSIGAKLGRWSSTNPVYNYNAAGIVFNRWRGTGTDYSNAYIGQSVSNASSLIGLAFDISHESSKDAKPTRRMFIHPDGNVGIGSDAPDSKLTVKGKIHCEEVQVDLAVPADYVFEKYYTGASDLKETYKMPTLEEIEAYTKENHHLPSVPSAKTIQEEGLHLKEMTNLLLQKIEELTLYTIEQNKELKTLKEKVTQLENK